MRVSSVLAATSNEGREGCRWGVIRRPAGRVAEAILRTAAALAQAGFYTFGLERTCAMPPSIDQICPVTHSASGEASQAMRLPT